MERQTPEPLTKKSKKPRCIARIIKSKQLWDTGKRPYLGTQCSRPCGNGSEFCCIHQTNRKYGIFGVPSTNISDLSEAQIEIIKSNPGLISYKKFKESKLPIHEYITSAVQSVTIYAPREEWNRQILETLHAINNNDGNKTQHDIFQELLSLSHSIPSRDMSHSPLPQQETEEFLKMKHWWNQQEKVTITDRFTHASTTFAKSFDNKFYTQMKQCVGEEKFWRNNDIPDSMKNSDGIILDPITHCYLTEISLYPEARKFHCLGKKSYSEYFYNTTTGRLQKSHEILRA